MPVKEIGF